MADISQLFHGAVRVEERCGTYLPVRFSEERTARYDLIPEKPYAKCPASVYMEFDTASSEISFHFDTEKLFFIPVTFDIYENGSFSESVSQSLGYFCGDVFYKKRTEGLARIRIYLPACAQLRFSSFSFGNWSAVAESDRKLLFFGDSISQGLFGKYPSLGLVPTLGRLLKADYLNLSVGGECYLPQITDDIVYRPDYIFVALGTNDFGLGIDERSLRERIDAFYDRIHELYSGIPVTVILPPYLLPGTVSDSEWKRFLHVRDIIMASAENHNLHICDGFDMIPRSAEFFTDSAHPNDLGFQQYANSLFRLVADRFA